MCSYKIVLIKQKNVIDHEISISLNHLSKCRIVVQINDVDDIVCNNQLPIHILVNTVVVIYSSRIKSIVSLQSDFVNTLVTDRSALLFFLSKILFTEF